VRPCQSALDGVARHGLLVILDVVANLKGCRPRNANEIEDPGATTSDISWQGRARTLLDLLYLRGGDSRHTDFPTPCKRTN
jgi:hypothetical protein